jgi:tetratricopeptide (TPR) repeat protein
MKKNLAALALALTCPLVLPLGAAFATCGGGGGGGMGGMSASDKIYDVPWQQLKGDVMPSQDDRKSGRGLLSVYWVPLSDAEQRFSPLMYSRQLSIYGGQCVNLYVVKADTPVGQKLLGDSKAPKAFLIGQGDTVIGTAVPKLTRLEVEQVEELVSTEVKRREEALKASMDDAEQKAKAGETQAAIDTYKQVLEQKCLFPKRAREAVRRLKKLGAPDVEANIPDGASHDPALGLRVTRLMAEGLRAEEADKYTAALKLYSAAHSLDPGDPVPLRFLGELYRHDLGDWDKATEIFHQILSMEADPLSRAVALHGLGKMTIHNGEFKKGLALMEESTRVYPLALAYRNLAVYWNSEGDPEKANQYTQEAFKLDPKDPFNRVFAAVFMAGSGHKEEALKVARENSGLMCASYNLAAIYAQSGDSEKALQLLRRHFFQYERYQAVRTKEMMEARVDHVFDSLKKDKTFLSLTSGADGKLKMR